MKWMVQTVVFLVYAASAFGLAGGAPEVDPAEADAMQALVDRAILAQAPPSPPKPEPQAAKPVQADTNGAPGEAEDGAPDDAGLEEDAAAAPAAISGGNLAGADVQIESVGSDTLILSGSEDDLAMLQALFDLLDRAGPRKEVRVVTLKQQGSTKIAEKVQSILQKMVEGTPDDQPQNRATVVAVTANVVLVAAPATKMDMVVGIIEAIDTAEGLPQPEMMTFNVKHRKASEAAEQLKKVLDTLNQNRGEQPGPEFQVIPIDANNSIMITAPESDRAKLQTLLDSIDVEPVKGYGETMLVVFPLLNSKATEMAETINKLLTTEAGTEAAKEVIRRLRMVKQGTDGTREELPPIDLEKPFKVIPDEGTESLIVATVEENIEPMSEILKILDGVPVGAEIGLRIRPLLYADAQSLEERLTDMFEAGKDLPKPAPGDESSTAVPEGPIGEIVYNVAIVADARTNTLVYSGRAKQIALIDTIIESLDIPSCAVKFPLRLITLEHSDATRIGDVITKLWEQRIEQIQAGEPGESAVEREKVFLAVDIRSNSLIVSASEENFAEIADITQRLDGTADRLVENIRFIHCENTSAADLASKIEELWERKANLRREGELPEDLPVIVADQRSNTLVVASSPEDFEEMDRLVKKLESQPLAPIAGIRLIPLKNNDASAISDMLKTLFEERMQQRLAEGQQENPSDRVALANDPATNTVLVASSKENYEEMVRIVEVLDAEPDLAGVLQVFVLENAEATNVAEKINELFDKGIYMPVPTGSEIIEERKKVALVADPRSNAVIASASKTNLSIIESLIKTMDTAGEPRPEQDTRIFALAKIDAIRLVDMLDTLFEGMKSNATEPDLFQVPTIIADERSNSLIVTGSRDSLKRAEDLIGRIEAQSDNRTATFEIYQLAHASAAKLAAKMQEMFEKRNEGGGTDSAARTPIHIQAEESANSLIVTASRDDHTVLQGLLALLDKPSNIARQFEIFPLRVGKAEPLAERLENLFQSQAQGQSGGQSRADVIAVEPDLRTNSLIVWAAPSEMDNIALIIDKLDTVQPGVEMQLRVIQLKNALAEDFAEKFTETISGGQQGGGSSSGQDSQAVILTFNETLPDGTEVTRKLLRQDITVTPDPRTNAVMVMAPAESMAMLDQLIREIDKLPPQLAEIRLFPLVNGDAEEMVDKLKELFGEEQSSGTEPEQRLIFGEGGAAAGATAATGAGGAESSAAQGIRFAADRRTNTVIAAGAEGDLNMAEKLIARLDGASADDRISQVYEVKYSTAEDITGSLKDFVTEENERLSELDDESSLIRRAERHVTVIGDETSNSVLLGISPRNYSNVMEMIRQIDRPPPQVMIKVLIAEVALSDTVEFGMEWALQDLTFTENAVIGPNGVVKGSDHDFVAGTDVGAAGSGGGFTFSITGEDFSFLLHALQSEGMVEVLSRPTILVENNEEANITIGDEAPFVSNSNVSDSGQVSNTVQYKDVGIILDVTPHINPDGYVNLEVRPEISSINPSGIPISEGLTAPTFSKRSAETVITVKDGETVVIGGLINTREAKQESKVPIMGDIPGLGPLFRATNSRRERTELLIMLTVDVLRDEFDAYQMSVEQRDKSGLLPENILRSPLMEGLRILPDEEAFGPKDEEAGEPGRSAPRRERIRPDGQNRELYGPTPDVYGPSRPQRVQVPVQVSDPSTAAVYGPTLPTRTVSAKP